MIKKAVVALILIVAALFVYNFYIKPPGSSIGEKAPQFSGTLINGEPFSLSDLRGQYVLIDFWGSWCAPCRKDFPHLRNMYSKFKDQAFQDASGFEIVSIALEKSDKQTRKIIEREELNWPYHIIDVRRAVLMSPYALKYGVSEVPTKILINPDGEIMGFNLSFEEMARILTNRI